jgi:DNA-binding transcriptional MerR regulator
MGENVKKKPFYRNAEDTLEDVGITQRQLGYWRKHGLFNPELGPKTKYFTEQDTDQLRFLKRLIVDLELPVDRVKILLDSINPNFVRWGATHIASFIDVENMRLIHPLTSISRLMGDAIARATPDDLEQWFYAITLHLFEEMASTSNTLEIYEARKKALLDQLNTVDLMARSFQGWVNHVMATDPECARQHPAEEERHVSFWPPKEDDPTLTQEEAERLVARRQKLMKPVDAGFARAELSILKEF